MCVQEILDGIKIKNNGMYFINTLQPPLTIQSSYILVVEIPIQDKGLPQENKKKTWSIIRAIFSRLKATL